MAKDTSKKKSRADNLLQCVLCGREIESEELMEYRLCRKHFMIFFVACTEISIEMEGYDGNEV